MFRHRHRRTGYGHRAHLACGLAAILAIVTGCATTLPPSDEKSNDPPPGPTDDGDDDLIAPAGVEDSDGDGVIDDIDECGETPAGVDIDAVGCPITVPGTPDTDQDGVPDDGDQCSETPPDSVVNGDGCAEGQLDVDRDGVTDDQDVCPGTAPRTDVDETGCAIPEAECGNGIVDVGEQCDPPDGIICDGNCLVIAGGPPPPPPPVCGNGVVEAGEECDDGNGTAGDGCDPSCRTEGLENDNCASPLAIGDGETLFDNTGASTDGPEEPEACTFSDSAQVESDVWFCYSASCGGEAVASLCGSNFDTKMAVYAGCDCPSALPIGCSDDDCGVGVFDSRVAFQAVAGQFYMIRVGGFGGDQGDGTLTIRCGVDSCGPDAGDCFAANDGPGCGDQDCCSVTCEVDAFCCDVVWDDLCSSEASGLCTGNFAACAAGAGSCDAANGSAGCDTAECCNSVCRIDPFCCVDTWDDLCAGEAAGICGH